MRDKMKKSKSQTYYVVYTFNTRAGSITGTINMVFSNPTTFNIKMTKDFISMAGVVPTGPVVILSWKKLTKAEEKLNAG